MTNYKVTKRYYTTQKPRMTEWEALELLPTNIRKILHESVQPWSAIWTLKQYRKVGREKVIEFLRNGDKIFCSKGFIIKRGRGVTIQSSYIECKVEPLQANW